MWIVLLDIQHWIAKRHNSFFSLASNQAPVQSCFSSVTPCRSFWQWSCCIMFCHSSAIACLMGLPFQETFCETCFPSWPSVLQNISFINTVCSVTYFMFFFATQYSPVTCIDTFIVPRMTLLLPKVMGNLCSLVKVGVACKHSICKPSVSW